MSTARWEHFPHGSDIGIRGYGSNVAGAFTQIALALSAVIADPTTIVPHASVAIRAAAPDLELLLVDWLNALIYEMATRKWLFSRFDVRIEATSLEARIWGERVDIARHKPAVEVKAATYTELRVVRLDDGNWLAQCVVDV